LTGAISGLVAAMILSFLFSLLAGVVPSDVFYLNWIQAVALGAFIGVFGQLGDLAESLLKRDANVKDSNTIPGIGGVLDLLDSLLFTIPIVYLFLRTSSI